MDLSRKILMIVLILWAVVGSAVETTNNSIRGLEWQGSKPLVYTPYVPGKYRAVLIGNNQYRDEKGIWKDLQTPTNDAEAFSTLLKQRFGFEDITMLTNASRKDILHTLKELTDRVEPNDNVIIYYAGHGFLDSDQMRGYWVPTDARGLDHSTFIRNSTIRNEINIIANKAIHTLLISDSCFSGSLLRGPNRGTAVTEKTDAYYQKVMRKKSVQVLAAGGNEYVDDSYRNSGHSPFTYFLLHELSTNDQKQISFSELATKVKKLVANNVDQTPEAGILQGAGDELGEFIFARVSDTIPIEKTAIGNISSQSNKPSPLIEKAIVMPVIRF